MDRSRLFMVIGVAAVVVVGAILLLTTGDSPTGTGDVFEETGDVIVHPGDSAPADTTLADIQDATVARTGNDIVFEVTLAAPIPKKVKGGSFSVRWDVKGSGGDEFIVSGNLDVGPNISVVGINNKFGSSSIDKTFPGDFAINGNTWRITLSPRDVPDWPDSFSWKVTTKLDGSRGDPQSAYAEDSAPSNGFGELAEA